MKVIATERIPIKMWLPELEEGALNQAKNLANLPFAFKHVAIMPDSHVGYGMPIGGVLATIDNIIPNAVGVDIGCGMRAAKIPVQELENQQIMDIMGKIRKRIPVGFNKHEEPQNEHMIGMFEELAGMPIVAQNFEKCKYQIGTLGGGNHFIEIQMGDDGHIWIMIHSGSRNLGYQVARYYNDLAKELNAKWYSEIPAEHELAFLPVKSSEGLAYLREMDFCVRYAQNNRRVMLGRCIQSFVDVVGVNEMEKGKTHVIDVSHNYVAIEHHFQRNVWIHRKGATAAYSGDYGIIPGSQGTSSFIVKGKGNAMSFKSCSHGAGRAMGRKEAKRVLDWEAEKALLDEKGVIHAIQSVNEVDEAPSAYKDIDVVMSNQADLVDIVVKLQPRGVVKG